MINYPLFRKLFVKLLASYMVVVILALTVLGVLFVYMMHKYFFQMEGWELTARADKVISLIEKPLTQNNREEIQDTINTMAYSYDVKLWVMDKSGKVLASSETEQPESGLELEKGEMENVLAGNTITKQITGPEFNSSLYVKPITSQEQVKNSLLDRPIITKQDVLGVLAVEAPLGGISSTITNIAKLGGYATLPGVLLAIFVGFTLSRRISRPIEEMNKVAGDISRGKLDKRVQYKSGDEMEQLALTFNHAVEQIVSTVEQQKKLERLRKEFLSNVAHEFKAPLTSIRGFVELMLDGKLKKEQQNKYLDIMLQDSLHLNRLVQDLLDLSSLESGDVSLRLTALQPQDLVYWVIKHFQHETEKRQITLSFDFGQDLPLVKADRDRMHQVLLNLVNNAIKNTAAGGEIKITVNISREDPKMLCFLVRDTGCGIPRDEIENIWERFHKVDRARTRNETGTGLGLAIVKEIIKLHGGQVYVYSKLGVGSSFGFSLPV